MNGFYVVNGKKLKQMFIVAVALIFALGIIYAERANLSVFAQKEPAAIYNVKTDKKVIALTFDISWGDKRAEPILSILEEKGVRNATFFLSSPWAKSHSEVVEKIAGAGFEIGNHGHKHLNYSTLDEKEIRNQIETAHQILSETAKTEPNLLRLPNGDFDKRVLKVAGDLGYTVIQWDTDSQDWLKKGTNVIIDRVLSKAHPGDIVLLHASDSAEQTIEALPVIIDRLKAQGYEFATVSELIHAADSNEQEVKDQTSPAKPSPSASVKP